MIEQLAETGSTNADMVQRATEGAPEGLWLRADRQTGGRGRLGRQWLSPQGNLYASTLVRLRSSDPPAHTLSLLAAVALWQALAIFAPGADLLIKWPNDVLLGGDKLAGILLERQGDHVVIGIGINLAEAPDLPDRTTAALSSIVAPPDPQIFCEALAQVFGRELARWRDIGLGATVTAWLAHAHPTGTRLSTTGPEGQRIEGEFMGLTPDAMLNLRLPGGESVVIHSGDIEIAPHSSEHR